MRREALVERRLVRAVERVGGFAYKFESPGRAGVPDRVCLFPDGRIVFVEVKAPGGKVSELQKVEIARIRALGFEAVVVFDDDGIARVVR